MKTRVIALLFMLLVFAPSVLAQSGGEESPGAETPTPAAPIAPAAELPIRMDTPLTVHLVGDTAVNLSYKISGEQVITITARSLEAEGILDPVLTVIDPTGVDIAENDDHRTSRTDLAARDSLIADLNLSDSGRYTIQVRAFDASADGDVEVLLTSGNAVVADTPTSEVVNDRVPDNAAFSYDIEARAGEIVTITVRARDNQLDPKVALLDIDGIEVASNDDHTLNDPSLGPYDSQIFDFEIPKTSAYTIQITGFAGIGGDFELTIDRGSSSTQPNNPTPPPLVPTEASADNREVVQGTIDPNGVYTYGFTGEAGEVYTITAQATSGDFDPRLAVYDSDDTFVADNDDYGTTTSDLQTTDARIYNLIIINSGRYEVDVRGYRDSAGDFTLTIERVATNAPTGLPTEQVELGSVTPGETYSLDFDAQAGDWVTISVRGLTRSFDSYVALVNDAGTVLLDNDDHGSAFLGELGFLDSQITNYHITNSGTYTIEVTDVGGTGGSFGLTISTLR